MKKIFSLFIVLCIFLFSLPTVFAMDPPEESLGSMTELQPGHVLTNLDMITYLWKLEGCAKPTIDNPYNNISLDDTFYDAIVWAYEAGIHLGTAVDSFDATTEVSRSVAIQTLYNYYGYSVTDTTDNPFGDISPSDECYEAILWALATNHPITTNIEGANFSPDDPCRYGHLTGELVYSPYSGACGDNLFWEYQDGILSIFGSGAMEEYENNEAPWINYTDVITDIHMEDGITSIGSRAFAYIENVTNVSIPDSVTSIGIFAFRRCYGLSTVKFPAKLTAILDNAFYSCTSLSDLSFPEGLLSIGRDAFWDCKNLTKITLPDTLEIIESSAFCNCTSLSNLILPANLTSIGQFAFSDCDSLTRIEIPASVTYIGEMAFWSCERMTEIIVDDNNAHFSSDNRGVLFNNDQTKLIAAPSAIVGKYTIPDTVSTIGNHAFDGCFGLTEIEISNSVTVIGNYAFCNCQGLTEVTIPETVTRIDWLAFSGCTGLTSVEIPSGITLIDVELFSYCSNLCSISIPDSVTLIEPEAFNYCDSLADVYYSGSEEQWNSIEIGYNNLNLINATIHYRKPDIHQHDYTAVVTAPTCTQNGYTTYTCICEESYVGNETDALGHAWDEGIITIEAGCVTAGVKTFTCTRLDCGETKTENIVPHGHTGVLKNELRPTCSTVGYTGDIICTICDEIVEKGAEINTIPHTQVIDLAVAATCASDGLTEGKHCSVCQSVLVKQETVPATGHSWGEWKVTKPATGAEMGEETRSCTVCGLEESRSIDKLSNPFVDVQAGKFYETPVLWAVENGVTNGMDATHFAPNDKCTRAQVVTFLWRAAGSPEPTSSNNPFEDVVEGKFYYKAVLWAVEEGITNGVDATHFGTNDECTRGHVATFLWRTLGKPTASSSTNPFGDVAQGKFYYDAVLWAAESGVTTGIAPGKFDPSVTCTRGQIVTFLYRALG